MRLGRAISADTQITKTYADINNDGEKNFYSTKLASISPEAVQGRIIPRSSKLSQSSPVQDIVTSIEPNNAVSDEKDPEKMIS